MAGSAPWRMSASSGGRSGAGTGAGAAEGAGSLGDEGASVHAAATTRQAVGTAISAPGRCFTQIAPGRTSMQGIFE